MKENRIWGSYTSREIQELIDKDPVVILSVGSYEQHGPHLTLDTDSNIAFEIAKGTVEKSKVPCSYLPVINIGISEHHMNYPGSLTLRPSTLMEIIYDILNSLNRNGIKKVLIINGHGGNMTTLNLAINTIGSELAGEYVLVSYWDLVSDVINEITNTDKGAMDHAGELETALKLYLSPEDVRKNLLTPGITSGNEYWKPENMSNKVSIYRSFDTFTKLGHIGDPTKSTIEMGQAAFELIVNEMVKLVEFIYEGKLETNSFRD